MTGKPSEMRRRTDPLVVACGALSLFCAVVVAVGAGFIISNTSRISGQDRDLQEAALGQCERVNLLRRQDNTESAVIWRVLTAASERMPAGELQREYQRLSRWVTYLPQTDCRRAVRDPLAYRAGRAVPFHRLDPDVIGRLLPPPPSPDVP